MSNFFSDWAWPWWTAMVIINAVNVVLGVIVYKRSLDPRDGSDLVYRKRMRIMGAIFTLVAAYRSVFVSRYMAQQAWFDTVANSSLLIRLLAIAAELSFSGLIALALLKVNRDLPAANSKYKSKVWEFLMTKSPYVLMACLLLAQFFATSGLITKSKTLFAIEETLWSLGFLSVLPLAITQIRRVYGIKDPEKMAQMSMLRKSTILIAAWCLFYCCYGFFYHLPLESWAGAIDQIQTGLPMLKTGSGAIKDAFLIVNVTREFSDWGYGFLFWHSSYFSILVWVSIFLMQAPRLIRTDPGTTLE